MQLDDLKNEYDKLQKVYGEPSLNSIYYGGKTNNPDICFVFMNPTGRNIASLPNWNGPRSPWIGTKNIWDLFYAVKLFSKRTYDKIKKMKPNEWNEDFAIKVYKEIENKNIFITNLAKCTQIDARVLEDKVFKSYLSLFETEIRIINPKVIILFGNQVSSIFLNKKISVSQVRKERFEKTIDGITYPCYAVYYPIGNGRFNIDKSIEDIKWIRKKENL